MNDVSVTAVPQVTPVEFANRPGFIRLLIKNTLLTIVTLGFYRFWGRTAVRRALWNNIVIGGEPLEYTGRGIELFIGFLIALAIIAPMAAIYGAIQYVSFASPVTAGALYILYFAVLGILVQIAVFRARRYRLSRTQWRGIRCWQDGSSWRYVGISLIYGLLTLATLGLASPWLNTALQRYKIEHTIFGDRRFSFTGSGRGLILRWLMAYVLGALPVLIFIALNMGIWLEMLNVVGQGDIDDIRALGAGLRGWWLLPFIYIGGGLTWLWYRVAEFRYFVVNTKFGEIEIRSSARMSRMLFIALGYFGCLIGLFLLFLGIFVVMGVALGLMFGAGDMPDLRSHHFLISLIPLAMIIIVYVLNNILVQYFLTYRVAQHLCETLEVTNLTSVDSVVQSAQGRPRYGEGLADAFDLGAV